MRYRIGVDIGGTFTDFALFDDARPASVRPQAAHHAGRPVAGRGRGRGDAGRQGGGVDLADVERSCHGTTLVTNAVIERKGARTGDAGQPPASATCSISRMRAALRPVRPAPAVSRAAGAAPAALRGRRSACATTAAIEAPLELDATLPSIAARRRRGMASSRSPSASCTPMSTRRTSRRRRMARATISRT